MKLNTIIQSPLFTGPAWLHLLVIVLLVTALVIELCVITSLIRFMRNKKANFNDYKGKSKDEQSNCETTKPSRNLD